MHIEAGVMVGITHVSVIKEPDISHVKDLIALHGEEFLEVLRWFDKVAEPNHGGEVGFLSLQECASELDRFGGGLQLGLRANEPNL